MNSKTIHTLTLAGVLSAFIVLLTTAISIPIPGGLGYVNLGDAAVLFSAMLLGSPWGILCGGAASALSDLILGYGIYVPATLVIKAGMAAMLLFLSNIFPKKLLPLALYISSACVPFGYLLYESCLYGILSAWTNFGFNLIQALIGASIACLLYHTTNRIRKGK